MITADYLVIGSGLTGATIARILTDHKKEVLLLERRRHLGGNVYDFTHPSNIRVHAYGPHYFRCSSDRIWNFVNRFATFREYRAEVRTQVDGRLENWPINRRLFDQYEGWEKGRPKGRPRNFEEACLQKMPRPIYETFVQTYTARQWGVDPRLLQPHLANRIRINEDGQTVLMPHRAYQALPEQGYASFMAKLVEGIPHMLSVDFLQNRSHFIARKALIFTGAIDEFFGFSYGRLAYRSQRREHEYLPTQAQHQPCAQVNHARPGVEGAIRTIEWKHLMPDSQVARSKGTIITREYPFTPDDPDQFEYPFPAAVNTQLYKKYQSEARRISSLVICGRLGEYRYFDMDQAIARAMVLAHKIVAGK